MNEICETVNSVGVRFVDFAVPMLVQSTVLILILLFADALLRKKVRAVFRYWIWMVVLLKLVLPTSLSSPVSLGRWFGDELAVIGMTQRIAEPEAKVVPPPPATVPMPSNPITDETAIYSPAKSSRLPVVQQAQKIVPEAEPLPAASESTVPITPLSWQGILFLLWLVIVGAMGLLLLHRAAFVRGLVAQAKEADDFMIRMLADCCRYMRIRRKVGLKVSINAASPAVCGLFRPVILVPQNLVPSLSTRQLRVVLLHELAHIKRSDLWVNLAQTVLQIVYFYNPLFWLANAIIRRAREQAVDETVLVAMGEDAGQYPQALVDVAKLAFKRPALSLRLIGVVESKGALSGRIKRILTRPIPKTAKPGILGLIAIVVAAVILLPMAKSDTFGNWFGERKLIRFSSNEKPTGTWEKSGDTTTYSKNYTVKFRKDEKLAVVAELYQVGRPMRHLGCKLFTGSEEPQELSVILKKTHRNEDETSVVHDLKITLGDQTFRLNDIRVNTLEFFNDTQWHFFDGSEIAERQRDGRPYAEFENLLRMRASPNAGKPRAPRIWIPTYNNVTWVASDAHFISVNMLAFSQLDHLQVDVPHYAEKMQLPDGTYITGDSTKQERQAVADNYLLGIRRALMREQMPLPELTAHKYYKVGDPIYLSVDGRGSDQWKPTLGDIYRDGDVSPMFFLIDGKEYASRGGFGPFSGGGRTLSLPGELYVDSDEFHLSPGKHTVAYGWKDLDVINPDDPDRVVHYERLTTDVVEFEVVGELPADYYAEVYEEDWEEILRSGIQTEFSDEMRKFRIWGSLFALQIESLPFDVAFEIYAQSEGNEDRVYAGRLARQANTGIPLLMGCDHNVDGINWNTVGQNRWRLILVPSRKIAMRNPPIRHYYGREFTTEWATFEKTERFEENRRRAYVRDVLYENIPRCGDAIKDDKPVDLDGLNRRRPGDANEARPLPDGFELGWSDENDGTLRIDPRSDVRMLWFPEANANLVEVSAETRRRLVELPDSKLTEIHPPKGERTLIAVRSSEGRAYFVTVRKVNETWADLTWWPARGVDDGPFGRLVDTRGKGVGNATLVFYKRVQTEEKLQEITVTSEGSGAFILPKIEPGESMSVRISAPGFEELESVHIEHGASGTYFPENLIFTLHRLGTISGSVIGPDGKPLAGAPLSLSTYVKYPDLGKNISTSNQLRSISDSRGRFVMRDVPPGTHLLFYPWKGPSSKEVKDGTWRAFQKPSERWPSAPVKGVLGAAVIEVGHGQKVRDVVIDLSQSTCTAEGCVSDRVGRPVAGARVYLYWKISGHASSISGEGHGPAVTDSHGRYRLENLPPGDWHIWAWLDRPAMHSDEVPIQLGQGKTIRRDLILPKQLDIDNRTKTSSPIKNVLSSQTATGGTFEWETSIDPQVRFRHGWYTIEDGAIVEHSGGSGSRIPHYGPIRLKLTVDVSDTMLNLEMQRIEKKDDGVSTAKVGSKTSVPAGTSLKHAESIDSALLSNKHLILWQGDFVRDGRIVKSVVYAAYLTTPENQGVGFMPPELQKNNIVTTENNSTMQVGGEATWGEGVDGVSVRLGGSEPLGLFYSNNTLWFEVKNRAAETIEFNQEPCAQKGSADAQSDYLEISDVNGEAIEYEWRTAKKMWNLKPGKNYKVHSFINGRPLRKSGPSTYRARVTLVVRGLQSGKTFEVKSNWHPFEVTPCGYPSDFVPQTAYEQLRQADAYHAMIGFGHATLEEVIHQYEAIIEKYPNSKYELESHFGIAQAASENRDPSSVTSDDYALSRQHYQAIIKQWPDVVTNHTIHARNQAYFQTAEFKQSRLDLCQWLTSLTTEQKFNSMRHYFIWPFEPSEEDIQRALSSLDKAIAARISLLERDGLQVDVGDDEILGRVVDENGEAVPDAQVALSTENIGVMVSHGKLKPIRKDVESRIVQTDSQGVFVLGQQLARSFDLIVAHDKGFALVESKDFLDSHEIHLQPWGRIEGQVAEGRYVAENKIWMAGLPNSTWFRHKREYRYETECDADRCFVFEKVPEGWFEAGYLIKIGDSGWSVTSRTPVEVKAGETTNITLGGTGRLVVGKFVPPEGYDKAIYFGNGLRNLQTTRPDEPRPENYDRMTKSEQQQWRAQWRATDQYRQYRDAYWHNPNWRQYTFRIDDDGSFRIEDVIAGKYDLTVWIEERITSAGRPEEIGSYYGTIKVPEMPGGRSDEPLDLGELELAIHEPLHVGDMAPLFEAKTLDGKTLKLIDYRDKFVLLSFWQPVYHPEIERLRQLYDTYNPDGRLEIIGVGGHDTLEEVRKYVEENDIPWPQIFMGKEFKAGIAKDYRIPGVPWIFLIGPNGRIVTKNLRGEKLTSAVQQALEAASEHKPNADLHVEPGLAQLRAAFDAQKFVHSRDGFIALVQEIGNKEPESFLIEQLESDNRARRCQAALALEILGDRRGIPVIVRELNDIGYRPTTRIRSDGGQDQKGQIRQDHYYAALLLGISGDKRAVPALIEATRDEEINYQAAISLGQIGDMRAVLALRAMLEKYSNKPFVRLFAGYGLAMLNDEEGLRVVIDTLNNQELHWVDRRHAIRALGELRDKQAVPHLIVALKDDHPNIRVSAARALGAIGDTSALPALEQALKDKTETKVNAPTTVSKAAAEAIAQIKAEGRKAAVQIEDEIDWGEPVDGIQCKIQFVRESYCPSEDIEFDLIYRNVSNRPITVYNRPDPFWQWIKYEIRNDTGFAVKRSPVVDGLRWPLKLSDFVHLSPRESTSCRYVIKKSIMGKNLLEPARYRLKVEINRFNQVNKVVYSFDDFSRQHNLKPWIGVIESGSAELVISPLPPIQWRQTKEGLQIGVGRPELVGTSANLPVFLRNVHSGGSPYFDSANFDVEMDGRLYVHRNWMAMNARQETIYPGQIRGPIQLALADYIAEKDRSDPRTASRPLENLTARTHHLKVTYVGRNGTPRLDSPEFTLNIPNVGSNGTGTSEMPDQGTDGLQISLTLEKTTFALDEPIPVTWRIKNVSNEDKTIVWHELHYCPALFEIGKKGEKKYIREDDRRLWGLARPRLPEKIVLRPGDVREATFDLRTFGLRQRAGTYEVKGLYSPKDNRMFADMFLQKSEFKDVIDARIESVTTVVTLTENLDWLKKELSAGTFYNRLTAARRLAPIVGNKDVLAELEKMYPAGNTRETVWLVDHMAQFGDKSHVPDVLDMYEAGGYAPYWKDYGDDMLVFLLKWGGDRSMAHLVQYLETHKETSEGTAERSIKRRFLRALIGGTYWYFDFEVSDKSLPLLVLALDEKTVQGGMTFKSKLRWCDRAALAIQKKLQQDFGFKLELSEEQRDEIINQIRTQLAARNPAEREGISEAQADFESLSVEISGIWRAWQKSRFKVMGDGSVEFSMSEAPNNPERYKTTFKLKRKDLVRLNKLLEQTGWLTKPGANVEPGYTDASRIEMTMSRHGNIHSAWCHDRNPEPYGALVKFIEQLYRQEDLFKRMGGSESERLSAAREIWDEFRSMRGEPVSAGPVRILDYHRFVPVCVEILSDTDANHRETIRAALWLLAYLREESQRDLITELTTAKQTSSEPQFSEAKTEYTQVAAIKALVALGGNESVRYIRTLAEKHAERKKRVNDAIVEALFELDALNSIGLLTSMLRTTPSAGWALIRLGEPAIPAIVEVLNGTPKPIENMGQIYLIRQYIDNWENVRKPIDERVITAVKANLDYRLGGSSDWTGYHKELLRLANVSEPEYGNSRQIAEQFLLAVKDGNDELLTRSAQVKSDWRDSLVSLRQLPDLEKLEIVEVYKDQADNVAWAACFDINNLSSYDHYVFIILNFLSGKVWRVVNISIEDTPVHAERLYRRFLEKYPDPEIKGEGVSQQKGTVCRTPGELMERFLKLAREGDPAAGKLFAENIAPDVTRLLQWWGGSAYCEEMAEEYHQMRAELLAGLTAERKQFYKKAGILDFGDEITQVGARAYAHLMTSQGLGDNCLKVLFMREGEDGTWQIVGLFSNNGIPSFWGDRDYYYLNPWSPAIHPAWGETIEYRISADDIVKGCYIDFDSRTLRRITPGSSLTREACVRLGIDAKCGYHESPNLGGLESIDLAGNSHFPWGLMTPLNAQLVSAAGSRDWGIGGGLQLFNTREGGTGVVIMRQCEKEKLLY